MAFPDYVTPVKEINLMVINKLDIYKDSSYRFSLATSLAANKVSVLNWIWIRGGFPLPLIESF